MHHNVPGHSPWYPSPRPIPCYSVEGAERWQRVSGMVLDKGRDRASRLDRRLMLFFSPYRRTSTLHRLVHIRVHFLRR